jgi:hypothetical protein
MHRDACGHLQGEQVRLQHAMTRGRAERLLLGEQRKTSARSEYFAF